MKTAFKYAHNHNNIRKGLPFHYNQHQATRILPEMISKGTTRVCDFLFVFCFLHVFYVYDMLCMCMPQDLHGDKGKNRQ